MNTRRATAYLLLTTVLSCGDDSSAIKLPFEGTTKASELSASDLRQICVTGVNALKKTDLLQSACAAQGLAAEGSCEQARQNCLGGFDVDNVCEDEAEPTTDCDVTVAEIEQCMNDTLALLQDKLPKITCSTTLEELKRIGAGLEELDVEPAPSCDVLERRCGSLTFFPSLGGQDD